MKRSSPRWLAAAAFLAALFVSLLVSLLVPLFTAWAAAAAPVRAQAVRSGQAERILYAQRRVHPSQGAAFILAVSGTGRCSLRVDGTTATASYLDADRLLFSVMIKAKAAPGDTTVQIGCDGQAPLSLPLQVVPLPGRPTAPGPIVQSIWHVYHPTAMSVADAWRLADAAWARDKERFLAQFANGQCTDLASRMRPDVVARVYEARDETLSRGRYFPLLDFTAENWAALARAAGLAVGARPRPGALVVWQPGVEGAGLATGHIGYVTAVHGSTFTTREENWGGRHYHVGSRTLSSRPLTGRLFIYR